MFMTEMQISKIIIEKLFGLYSYTLNLKNEGIDIIFGPNGYGKTTILKIINAIFTDKLMQLLKIPFDSVIIEFQDNQGIKLKNISEKKQLIAYHLKNGKSKDSYSFPTLSTKKINKAFLNYLTSREDIFKLRDYYEAIEKYKLQAIDDESLLEKIYSIKKIKYPDWLKNLISRIKIRFIKSERIVKILGDTSKKSGENIIRKDVVDIYSNKIKSRVNKLISDYGNISQKLDQSFPSRLIDQIKKKEKKYDTTEIAQKELTKLQIKQKHLIKLGLFEKTEEVVALTEIDSSILDMLNVYIPDVYEKLKIFDELADKIELFSSIIKELFLNKYIIINKDKGFYFKNDLQQIIKPNQLSSGEQHIIILIYKMLFKTEANTYVLIDEPEISLHVVWQKQFIENIKKISKINNFNCLIATHSPQIINNNWKITHDLEKLRNEG